MFALMIMLRSRRRSIAFERRRTRSATDQSAASYSTHELPTHMVPSVCGGGGGCGLRTDVRINGMTPSAWPFSKMNCIGRREEGMSDDKKCAMGMKLGLNSQKRG